MSTLTKISDLVIISIDKSEDSWEVEGEIYFEDDLNTPFEATYYLDDDELDELYFEIEPGHIDKNSLKEKIKKAALEFDE